MKRLQSRKDCKGYTLMKQLLINLELETSDYNWLNYMILKHTRNQKKYAN